MGLVWFGLVWVRLAVAGEPEGTEDYDGGDD